jgi:hypothetical protein
VPLLELALRRKLLTPEDQTLLKAQLEEIARMLSGLINGLENHDNSADESPDPDSLRE